MANWLPGSDIAAENQSGTFQQCYSFRYLSSGGTGQLDVQSHTDADKGREARYPEPLAKHPDTNVGLSGNSIQVDRAVH